MNLDELITNNKCTNPVIGFSLSQTIRSIMGIYELSTYNRYLAKQELVKKEISDDDFRKEKINKTINSNKNTIERSKHAIPHFKNMKYFKWGSSAFLFL